MVKLSLISLTLFLGACTHGQCNNTPQRPQNSPIVPGVEDAALPKEEKTPSEGLVQVFKPTGEKQCKMGKPIPLEEMKKSLLDKGIEVLESQTKDDGKMRAQTCGLDTGKIHVFLVPKNQVKKAQKLGFKVVR